MALLPEGWEADYDGTRWLYRYKATGLTQYHFPRSGDEFPELVGLGFGTLDGTNHSDVATKPGGNGPVKAASGNETDLMGATGYFDPDQFMYFGLNDVSPVGNENNTPISNNEAVLAELPESERIQSPVGLVAELASSETAKCAEELAPIELDATQMTPIALRVTPQRNGPTELPTSSSPVEQRKPIQHPVLESMQPVEEYPLVSASFAYPPLKTATRPVDNVVQGSNSPSAEQKVLSSSRPVETWADQNKYETWKPGQGSATEELRDSNRKSTALSSISVLQSQNSELGSMDQKRHSFSGPIETSEATVDLPGILRRPSDPRKTAMVHTPSPQVESSQIPAVLQPATTPLRTDPPQNNPQHHRPQSGVSLPGSGARHESISFGPGLSIVNSSSYQMPSVLKPAQSISTSEVQTPGDAATNDNCIGIHKVNTFPNQISSHTSYLPKIGGPGIYVFQEISAAPGPTIEQVQSKPHNHSNEDASSQELHQATEPYYSILNEPLPVIAPLSVSKPQTPTSPNQTSENSGTPKESRPPNSQSSSIHSAITGINNVTLRPSAQDNSHNEGPTSPAASSNETGAHPSQAQPHPLSPQATPTTQIGQHILTYNQRPQSISGPSQHSTELPHNQPAPIQEHNHGLAMSIQVSGQASFSGAITNQAVAGQAGVVNSQSTTQKPPSNPSQVTPSIKPATQTASQVSNQNMPTGMNIGTNRPQQSWSPNVHPVSPLQSQVSSPTPSIASLHRPPSSASSHTQPTTQGIIPQSRPPTAVTHQNTSQAPRPTGPQVIHSQGHAQGTQSPNAPGNASKPFPMLPGQVKPMPSQVGSSPIPIAAQPGQTGPMQAQHPLTQVPPMKPTQHQGIQQVSQLAVQRPPQQQHIQGHHMQVAGQHVPGTVHHGQPRPPVSAQQYIPAHVPQNTQTQGPYTHQGVDQISQSSSGQQTVSFAQGTHVQQHVSQTVQYPYAANISAAQSFHTGQPASQIQGQQHQQPTQTPSYQPGSSQVYGQGKPFNSAQATAAFSDAGKKMKKWAKKTWQNPTFKQATAAVGGAVFAESLGGNGVAGAALANQIYTNSQNKPQNNQPQRPPGPQHANTAPPQAQHPTGINATAQYGQAVNRPQLQQGAQPPSFQPGRPPVVQNLGVVGTAMNNNPSQPQVGMMNQQPVYQMSRPPVGRPPVTQAQQPATFSQPFYQGAPGQPIFQASPNQPLYQMHPAQQVYQARPGQPPLQAQDSTDTYAAIGATIGGALNALASGKPDSGAPAGSQQHHHTAGSEPQHESHPPQHHGPYPEPHHEAHSEQPYEGQPGEHHTEHAAHQESYADQQNTAYVDSQTTDSQVVMDNSTSEAYFAPQSDTTIINNTTINNVDNTAIAQSQQVNTSYTDNTNITDTSNMSSGTNAFTEDSSYVLDTSSANTQATAFTDTAYTDTAYLDATNVNTDTTSFGGSTYVDASYAGTSYSDMAYVDNTTMVDVNVDMNVNVDMSANYNDMTYMGDQMSTMDMQESVSVDASYVEESTVDYSGGVWGGGDW